MSNLDITYMEIFSIQTIIQFKWETYTKHYYYKRLTITLCFIFSLLFDLIFCQMFLDFDVNQKCIEGSRWICGSIIFFFFWDEVKQFSREDTKCKYFTSWWNIFDILTILVYIIYIPISFLFTTNYKDPYRYLSDKSYVVVAFQCLIVILTFVKIIFFLRVFEGLSFLVQMVTSVFKDLQNFMVFFSVFISTFAVLISVVFNGHQEDYNNLGGIVFLLLAFRTSVGDY